MLGCSGPDDEKSRAHSSAKICSSRLSGGFMCLLLSPRRAAFGALGSGRSENRLERLFIYFWFAGQSPEVCTILAPNFSCEKFSSRSKVIFVCSNIQISCFRHGWVGFSVFVCLLFSPIQGISGATEVFRLSANKSTFSHTRSPEKKVDDGLGETKRGDCGCIVKCWWFHFVVWSDLLWRNKLKFFRLFWWLELDWICWIVKDDGICRGSWSRGSVPNISKLSNFG